MNKFSKIDLLGAYAQSSQLSTLTIRIYTNQKRHELTWSVGCKASEYATLPNFGWQSLHCVKNNQWQVSQLKNWDFATHLIEKKSIWITDISSQRFEFRIVEFRNTYSDRWLECTRFGQAQHNRSTHLLHQLILIGIRKNYLFCLRLLYEDSKIRLI